MEVIDKIAKVKVMKRDKYYFPVEPVKLRKVHRKASISIAEVISESQMIDTQLAAVIGGSGTSKSPSEEYAHRFLNSIPATEKPLISISGSVRKLSSKLLRFSGLIKK